LYLCSSSFICPSEVGFVRRWLAAVRAHPDPALRSANVVVRPHPKHGAQWSGVSLSEFGRTVIWPPTGAAPLDSERKQDYFDHLFHAACVVGVNTSGFLEASILGRRTLTMRPEEFPQSQDGTLHFRYLIAGGIVKISENMTAHLAELATLLHGSGEQDAQVRRFVQEFLRPHGIETPCTPILADALKRLAAEGHRKSLVQPSVAPLVRALVLPMAMGLRRWYLARVALHPVRQNLSAAPAIGHKSEPENLRTTA
jgi:hypothetical protein